MNWTRFPALLREAAREWIEDDAPRLAASLSYYTLFSIAPLLVIAIGVAGLIFGDEAARGEVVTQVQGLVGSTAAKSLEELVENASKEPAGPLATFLGVVTLLFGASGAFGQLKATLNLIWEVPKRRGGILRLVRERFFSFTLVLGVGFLLLVSLVVSAGLAAVGTFLSSRLPGGEALWQGLNSTLSFAVITILFAVLFKYLPDKEVQWSDVWVGAMFTAALFTFGTLAIGLYLGKSALASTYGAAASVVIILVWIYYSALILFFGAEFTEVYARAAGRGGKNRECLASPEKIDGQRQRAEAGRRARVRR